MLPGLEDQDRDWLADRMLGFMNGLYRVAVSVAEVGLTECSGGISAFQCSGTAPTYTNGQEAGKTPQRKNTRLT